jgi:hypothetical protein
MYGRQFRDYPDATAIFRTKQFALLTSDAFLCLLASIPKTVQSGLELSQKDIEQFMQLSSGKDKFKDAARFFKKNRHFDEDSS